MHPDDTIAAIATPPGIGGIAVIRVSGPAAAEIGRKTFRTVSGRTPDFSSHRLYHGHIVSPEGGAVIDEVLAVLMRAPRSYTGEDVLEIHGHGGSLLPPQVLRTVLLAGARPAQPGEFTRRAFLNGRMDLSQAEAVADMIGARTDRALEIAHDQYRRRLSGRIEELHSRMTDILAAVEAAIEFSDEDPDINARDTLERMQELGREINHLAATYGEGRIYREGVRLVIAGRTNVGKSSLLNRLLGEKRAIVAAAPGTTRDFIEATADIGGIPALLTDTAGIRATTDSVEQEGIEMVWRQVTAADAVLLVLDGSEALTEDDREIAGRLAGKPLIPIINKADLPQAVMEAELRELLPGCRFVRISAKYGQGMEDLLGTVRDHFLAATETPADTAVITALRHKLALEKAAFFLSQATARAAGAGSPELVAAELYDAREALEEITGQSADKAMLDRIFANFCVGK